MEEKSLEIHLTAQKGDPRIQNLSSQDGCSVRGMKNHLPRNGTLDPARDGKKQIELLPASSL